MQQACASYPEENIGCAELLSHLWYWYGTITIQLQAIMMDICRATVKQAVHNIEGDGCCMSYQIGDIAKSLQGHIGLRQAELPL